MFPGANAQIYRNEVGEVIGWDYPSSYDENDWYDDLADRYNYDMEPEDLEPWECLEKGVHGDSGSGSRVYYDWISGWWMNGQFSTDWYCWITDMWTVTYTQQWTCDYCGEPFWSYWD